MIRISPGIGINDIRFGMTSREVNSLQDVSFFTVEYKNDLAIAISFQNPEEFYINEEIINIKRNFNEWIVKENPFLSIGNWVFPTLNLAVFGIENINNGIEITAYSDILKADYEKEISKSPRFNDLNKSLSDQAFVQDIIPHVGVGKLKFGMNLTDVSMILGKPDKTNSFKNNITIENRINIQAKYLNDELVQISINPQEKVLLNGDDISKLGHKSPVFHNESIFINRAYRIIFKYGISFLGYDGKGNDKSIIIFSEKMHDFWSNLHRPLI